MLSKGMTHTRRLSILININPCFKLAVSVKPYMTSHTFYNQVYRYLHILKNYKAALLFISINIIGHVPSKSVVHKETQELCTTNAQHSFTEHSTVRNCNTQQFFIAIILKSWVWMPLVICPAQLTLWDFPFQI